MKTITKLLRNTLVIFGKPIKCPNFGNTYFSVDHTGPRGEVYWSCNKCGWQVKD